MLWCTKWCRPSRRCTTMSAPPYPQHASQAKIPEKPRQGTLTPRNRPTKRNTNSQNQTQQKGTLTPKKQDPPLWTPKPTAPPAPPTQPPPRPPCHFGTGNSTGPREASALLSCPKQRSSEEQRHVHLGVCLYVCMYVYRCVCVCAYVYVHIYINNVYIYIYICIYIYTYVYVYVYVCVCIRQQTHWTKETLLFPFPLPGWPRRSLFVGFAQTLGCPIPIAVRFCILSSTSKEGQMKGPYSCLVTSKMFSR